MNDRVHAARLCRFMEGPECAPMPLRKHDRDRSDPSERFHQVRGLGRRPALRDLPPLRSAGTVNAQLLCSWRQAPGVFRILGVDRATGEQFSCVLGAAFGAFLRAVAINRNPRDLDMPHVPLFAHWSADINFSESTIEQGERLGLREARQGFELAKAHLT